MSDAAETRPAKRTRPSGGPQDQDSGPSSFSHPSTSSATKLQFKRHSEFWFDDGNIVLVARHVAFRIYRGLLASQSTVFSDMFASSSSSADETFEGCPLVQLSDSPNDLAHLLRVLLPKSRIHYQPTDADPIRTFDEPVQDQALAALQVFDFTDNFTNYITGIADDTKSLISRNEQAIGAVNLARLTDTPSMLPLAMYRCAYLGSALLEGWKRGDGTLEELSRADLRRCIDARVALAQEQRILLYRLFNDRPSHDYKLEEVGLCDACEIEVRDRGWRRRRGIWDKLPQIFNLEIEGWGEAESEEEGEEAVDDDE